MNHDIREKKIEQAVAKKEYEQAERLTEELYQEMPPIDATIPADFAETIMRKNAKGTNRMNRKKIKVGIIAVAALVAVSGTSVFAATTLSKYYKVENGKLVQTTKEDKDKIMEITEEQSQEATGDMVVPEKTYDTLETAEKESGITNMLPDGIQGYTLNSVSGLYENQDKKQENCAGISANFTNGDKTVLYDYFLDGFQNGEDYPNGTGETNVEPTSYTNRRGVNFTITAIPGYISTEDGTIFGVTSEGDEGELSTETMKTATVETGNGQLCISFMGLSDEEIYAVLDQVVLP